jgi:carbohydrate-selective porin OprB
MPTTTPNAAGGGFKLAGEKQIGRFVGYANYTYNTAEGGGISTTVSGQTAVAGLALLRPFDVRGEAAMGLMWSQSLPNIIPGVGRKNQYGLETYWNIGVTPNSSLTPGVQVILNPALNPTAHFVAVPSLKFRIFI